MSKVGEKTTELVNFNSLLLQVGGAGKFTRIQLCISLIRSTKYLSMILYRIEVIHIFNHLILNSPIILSFYQLLYNSLKWYLHLNLLNDAEIGVVL